MMVVQSYKLLEASQAYNMARQLRKALTLRGCAIQNTLVDVANRYATASSKEEAAKIKAEFDTSEYEMLEGLIERIHNSIKDWAEYCGTTNTLSYAEPWQKFCHSVSHDEALLIVRTVDHYLEESTIKQALLEGFALIAIQK